MFPAGSEEFVLFCLTQYLKFVNAETYPQNKQRERIVEKRRKRERAIILLLWWERDRRQEGKSKIREGLTSAIVILILDV